MGTVMERDPPLLVVFVLLLGSTSHFASGQELIPWYNQYNGLIPDNRFEELVPVSVTRGQVVPEKWLGEHHHYVPLVPASATFLNPKEWNSQYGSRPSRNQYFPRYIRHDKSLPMVRLKKKLKVVRL